MKCQSDKPYPKVEVERENVEFAKMLLDDYAGINGEDTAIHQYLYQSLVNDEVSKVLKEIAKVEMIHLNILGELICKLGYTPAFYTIDSNLDCIIPWNSNCLDYTLDVESFLLDDIEGEKRTIKRYQKHIEKTDDLHVQAVLKRIIEDEEVHINCLKELYWKWLKLANDKNLC